MFDFLRNLRKTADERQREAITAYLDNALAPRDRQRFEQELAQNPALQAQLEAERQIKTRLQVLPRRRVPRNFTLDPALYGRPQPQPLLQLYPVLRAATVLNAIVLIIILALSSFSNRVSLSATFSTAEEQQGVAESAPAEPANSITPSEPVTEVTEGEIVLIPTEEAAEQPAAEPAEDVAEESVADGEGVTAVSAQDTMVEAVATEVLMTSVAEATVFVPPVGTVVPTVQAPVIVAATATISVLPRPEATPTTDTSLRNSTEEPASPPGIADSTTAGPPATTQPATSFYAANSDWFWPAFLFVTWVILLFITLYVRRRVR